MGSPPASTPLQALRDVLIEGIRVADRVHADAARLRASLRELRHAFREERRATRGRELETGGEGEEEEEEGEGEQDSDSLEHSESEEDELPSDQQEEADEEEAEEAAGQAPVYSLACGRCSEELTRRGMQVWLVADDRTRLWSTDIPTDAIYEEGDEKKAPQCSCTIRAVHCSACRAQVGYHVLRPCAICGGSAAVDGNNGHYWLLHGHAVSAEVRTSRVRVEHEGVPGTQWQEEVLVWAKLPYNGVEEDQDEVGEDQDEVGAVIRAACSEAIGDEDAEWVGDCGSSVGTASVDGHRNVEPSTNEVVPAWLLREGADGGHEGHVMPIVRTGGGGPPLGSVVEGAGRSASIGSSPQPAKQGSQVDRTECCICLGPIRQRTRVALPCAHEFCFGCISKEVDHRGCCPLDRLPLARDQLIRLDRRRSEPTAALDATVRGRSPLAPIVPCVLVADTPGLAAPASAIPDAREPTAQAASLVQAVSAPEVCRPSVRGAALNSLGGRFDCGGAPATAARVAPQACPSERLAQTAAEGEPEYGDSRVTKRQRFSEEED